MSILESLKDYIETYPSLITGSGLTVDRIGTDPTQYSIVPLAGDMIIEQYIDDSSLRVFPFAFQSTEYTMDELERLQTNEFYEDLAAWFESQTNAGTLPSLETGKTAESIEALQWGYLFQEGNSDTGVYQIQCQLTYKQVSPV